ncbi:cytochrome P450 [Xylariaceae sp. FL0804]|nr:cytochrome P450 [Xylariaceae sp. FL0804]
MTLLAFFVSYAASAVVIYACLVLGYRVLLHPLRGYPGPLAARLSGAYSGLFALKGTLHAETYKSHVRYGPVVRMAPNRLVFNTVTALQDIYQNERIVKSYAYATAQPDQSNIFTTTSKREHRPKRRLISQLLSDQSMREFEPTMTSRVDLFLRQLMPSSAQPVDITPMCRHLGLEIAGLLGFGYDLRLQTDAAYRFLTKGLTLGNYRVNACLQWPLLARLKTSFIMDLFPNSLRARLFATISEMITTRMSEPVNARHDLLSVFHSSADVDVRNLRQGQLWTEAVFFFAAGGETIASALAAALFYLSRDRHCYETLAAEIRSTFNSGREITGGARLSGCRYLRACIDESLRMSPPVPSTLWREAIPDEQGRLLVVDGHVIPRGTQIGVNIYSLHHNEKYFPDSFRFLPERWMGGGAAEARLATHGALSPFSLGNRGCAGKAMAYLEISLVLAKTLWYYDFKTGPNEANGEKRWGVVQNIREFPIYDLFAASHDGPWLSFLPRGNHYEDLFADTA